VLAGQSEFLIWTGAFDRSEGLSCGSSPRGIFELDLRVAGEDGGLQDLAHRPLPASTFAMGLDELAVELPVAGLIQLETTELIGLLMVPLSEPLPSIVLTRLRSGERFGVGYEASPLADSCP
jgi:hypothetical protein